MTEKLEVVYGWRQSRPPRQWFYHLHRTRYRNPGEDFRTDIAVWMTRQEAEMANRHLLPVAGLEWVDAGEEPRWAS